VSKGKQVKSLMDTAASTFGSIDVIYANAGIGSGSMGGTWAHEIDDDDFMMVLAVNLGGIFYCAKYGLPYLVESKVSAVLLVAGMSMCWQQCSQSALGQPLYCMLCARRIPSAPSQMVQT
jgi:NAD(P)-dependent dehydrogenase (short-subunit alcohol dehydrogenase family)